MTTATKYKTYPKYKSSDIDWLGYVPVGWEAKRLRYFFDYHAGGVWGDEEKGDQNDLICLRVADFDFDHFGLSKDDLTTRNIPENQHSRILEKGDILLEKSGGGEKQTVGRAVRFDSDSRAVCSNFIEKLTPHKIHDSKYISYLMGALYFGTINVRSIKQTTGIQNLDIYSYFSEVVPFPEKTIQGSIADFLDRETAKIDEMVEKKQKMMEFLKEKRQALITHAVTKGLDPKAKMKPSGIDWLGDIPEEWDVKRLKYISNTRVSNVDKKSEDEVPVRLCNYIDVYKNEFINEEIDFMHATATRNQVDVFELKKGDIILTKDSETADDIGIPAHVDLEDTKNIVCGYHLAISTPTNSVLLGKYLFRLFQSNIFRAYFEVSSNGVTRFGLDTYSIFNADIPLPSFPDQHAIADFLDRETAKIDGVFVKIETQINKLKEYRQALITSAVTGKIVVQYDYGN